MAVRTKRLGDAVMSTSTGGFYTCPAGKTAIIKSINYVNPTGGAVTTVTLQIVTPVGTTTIVRDAGVAAGAVVRYNDLFIVLEPGDDLQGAVSVASSVRCMFHGAELDGVA